MTMLIPSEAFPMSSLDLLAVINQYRNDEGMKSMRHDNFCKKVRDELSNDTLLPQEEGPINPKNKQRVMVYMLTKFQSLRVAMRECKEVRRKVADYLENLAEAFPKPREGEFMKSLNEATARLKQEEAEASKCGRYLATHKQRKKRRIAEIQHFTNEAQMILNF